jgi:hypothetical protein
MLSPSTLHFSFILIKPSITVTCMGPKAEPVVFIFMLPLALRIRIVLCPGISLTQVPATVLGLGFTRGTPHETTDITVTKTK